MESNIIEKLKERYKERKEDFRTAILRENRDKWNEGYITGIEEELTFLTDILLSQEKES